MAENKSELIKLIVGNSYTLLSKPASHFCF